jgi:hypothetical protein
MMFLATNISESHGDPAHAFAKRRWRLETRLPALVARLVEPEQV